MTGAGAAGIDIWSASKHSTLTAENEYGSGGGNDRPILLGPHYFANTPFQDLFRMPW